MSGETKSFKWSGNDDDWNLYVSNLKRDGRTVQQDLSFEIQKKLTLIRHKDSDVKRTVSAHEDLLTEYVLENYNLSSIRPVTGKIHVKLTEAEHREFIESCGNDVDARVKSAAHNAIHRYWTNKIAQERIPKDEESFIQYKKKHNKPDELDRDHAIKQEIVKLNMATQGFFEAISKIDVTWECPIIPKIALSRLAESDINSVFQIDCSIIGPSQKKLNTETNKYVQKILIQETESDSINFNPMVIKCTVHGDNTSNLASGQRKTILGRYMVEPTVEGQKATNEKHLIIDAFHVKDSEEKRQVVLTKHQIECARGKVHEDEEQYLQYLIDSFCPKIYGRDLEKFALLLVLLGGSNTNDFRSETHLMLIGESDTGKSELVKFANKVAQKSSIIDGANTTGVGILFALDEYDGTKILRSGMMIQNSGGHLVIDEFDKMPKPEQKKVNNAMEQQMATYNKGGHIASAATKTAIIVSCNPEKERWNADKDIIDNLPFDASTISRYDVIIRLKHESTEQQQREKMRHIMQYKRGEITKEIGTVEYLKGLLNYLRRSAPRFDKAAEKLMVEKFVEFQFLEQPDGSLQVETRQMEGIQRLCEAYAKLTFRKFVDTYTVEYIIGFYKKCLATLGMNVSKGIHQVDLRGHSINREEYFEECFKAIADADDDGNVQESTLAEKLLENSKFFRSDKSVAAYLDRRKNDGWLFEPRVGILRRQGK